MHRFLRELLGLILILWLGFYVVSTGGCSSFMERVYYPVTSGGHWVWDRPRPTTQPRR